jgi:hypothetical protein
MSLGNRLKKQAAPVVAHVQSPAVAKSVSYQSPPFPSR